MTVAVRGLQPVGVMTLVDDVDRVYETVVAVGWPTGRPIVQSSS